MVYASRSRQALSSLHSNHSAANTSTSFLTAKSDQSESQPINARRTSRSGFRAKLAHATSTLFGSPSLAALQSCSLDIPLFEPSPASMQTVQIRAGLKRKKGAHTQLGIASNADRNNAASSDSLNPHHALTPSGLRRARSAASRNARNKPLNIITSAHIARDKPSSSASELSDWSSIASTSPTASRPPSSTTDQSLAATGSRPGIQTRRSSRNSLHTTLNGMSLEDSLALGLGIHTSSRSRSRSMSRQTSNDTVDHAESRPSKPRPRRSVSSGAAFDSDHSSDGLAEMDDQDAENARLISSAPNWQLHRLRKDDLIHLSLSAGAWEVSPSADELELLTKHDLVNKIITCRSRLDRSQPNNNRQNSGQTRRHQRAASASQRSFPRQYPDVFDDEHDETDALFMGSSSRKTSARLRRQSQDASSSYSADEPDAHLSDESNEAAGEETEAEPQRSQLSRRSSHRTKARAEGILRRMDSATFDQLEPSKSHQAPRRQLRDKTNLRGSLTRRLRIANGSEVLSPSTSSSVFGGRSSRASNNSFSPFARRYQHNVFVASSPIKTRSRTARLNLTLAKRRAEAASSGPDLMVTPRPGDRRSRRAKKSVKFNATPANASKLQEDDWMEDLSSDSEAVAVALGDTTNLDHAGSPSRGPRRTLRNRRSVSDPDADVSHDESRSRSASIEAPSELDTEVPAPEDDGDANRATSDEDAPTPTKFRKLRNGKLRLVAGSPQGASGSVSPETAQVDDVEMESAVESTAISKDGSRGARNESPESDGAPSESIETVMDQPNTSALLRLRKSELEQLCLHRNIDVDQDDKKANLVHKLLQWHQLTEAQAAALNESRADEGESSSRGSASDDDDDHQESIRSNMSTATATTEDETMKRSQRTPTRRRNTRGTNVAHQEATDSDQPLLLRARGKRVSSDKLPTPPLTSNNEEANPPQAGDGVDELNGLDLESLNLTDKEIHPSKLEKLEKIGSGGFKDVYVGKYRISKARVNKVAIADIRDQLTEMDIKELSLLRDLRHENIVRFIGVSIPEDPRHVPCMIVSELCSNGDLFDYIRNTPAPCDAEVFRILLETARGLEYLHTRTPAIIHRDCKSTNVLITRRKTAKINDFGLARVKNTSRSMMRSLVGTVNWQAVELWVPKPHYNEKVDVWSAAMTFWEALQWHQPEKKYPFQGMNEHQIYQDVGQKRQRPYTGAIRRQFGGEIVDLLDRMWDQTPKNRPTMTEVCEELEALIQMKKKEAGAAGGK